LLGLALAGAIAVTLGGSHAQATQGPLCSGHFGTIYGAGTINGTPKNDVIIGSGGDDIINGGGGDDIICGEGGADIIDGGTGDDILFGEADYYDYVYGNVGPDTIYGGSGDDAIYDFAHSSVISGGSGRDYINAYGQLSGDGGVDEIIVYEFLGVPSTVNGGTGQDSCYSRPANGDTETSCELEPVP
jgi:Ca2+-binding RTX toxin-like protein